MCRWNSAANASVAGLNCLNFWLYTNLIHCTFSAVSRFNLSWRCSADAKLLKNKNKNLRKQNETRKCWEIFSRPSLLLRVSLASCSLAFSRIFIPFHTWITCVAFWLYSFFTLFFHLLLRFVLFFSLSCYICGHGLVCLFGVQKPTYERKRVTHEHKNNKKRWRWNRYHLPKLKLELLIGFILDGNFVTNSWVLRLSASSFPVPYYLVWSFLVYFFSVCIHSYVCRPCVQTTHTNIRTYVRTYIAFEAHSFICWLFYAFLVYFIRNFPKNTELTKIAWKRPRNKIAWFVQLFFNVQR